LSISPFYLSQLTENPQNIDLELRITLTRIVTWVDLVK